METFNTNQTLNFIELNSSLFHSCLVSATVELLLIGTVNMVFIPPFYVVHLHWARARVSLRSPKEDPKHGSSGSPEADFLMLFLYKVHTSEVGQSKGCFTKSYGIGFLENIDSGTCILAQLKACPMS